MNAQHLFTCPVTLKVLVLQIQLNPNANNNNNEFLKLANDFLKLEYDLIFATNFKRNTQRWVGDQRCGNFRSSSSVLMTRKTWVYNFMKVLKEGISH